MKSARPTFRRGDIMAVVLGTAAVVFSLWVYFKYPDWRRPSGFGPEWECTERGVRGGGPSFCIRKPVPDPAKKE
jgi:hypothetical protein